MTFQARALRLVDAGAGVLGILDRKLSAEQLVARACRQAGMDDFGDAPFMDPLRRFLAACDDEAALGVIGRIATQWDVVRFLTNLLRLRAEEKRAPDILAEPIRQPIFITGLPRSGTTFLHRMLLEDPATMAPLVWQTIYPYPTGPASERDRRVGTVEGQLRAFERLAPDFRALHPLDAGSPQECSEITAHIFRSLRFDSNYHVPGYRSWLDADGHLDAYRFHKRFLQHLQHQAPRAGGRWVVKCPDHIFALDAIRAVYPDAGVVFVHRDPLKVLLSVAKLTEVIRAPFTRRMDREEIGRAESARYVRATELMMEASRTEGFERPILHVSHEDLIADPLGSVRGLYAHFGLELDAASAARVSGYAEARPNGGYGARNYRFEDHGLDPEAEREKFSSYMRHFGLLPEQRRRDATLAAD
jgi:hypothetical protein